MQGKSLSVFHCLIWGIPFSSLFLFSSPFFPPCVVFSLSVVESKKKFIALPKCGSVPLSLFMWLQSLPPSIYVWNVSIFPNRGSLPLEHQLLICPSLQAPPSLSLCFFQSEQNRAFVSFAYEFLQDSSMLQYVRELRSFPVLKAVSLHGQTTLCSDILLLMDTLVGYSTQRYCEHQHTRISLNFCFHYFQYILQLELLNYKVVQCLDFGAGLGMQATLTWNSRPFFPGSWVTGVCHSMASAELLFPTAVMTPYISGSSVEGSHFSVYFYPLKATLLSAEWHISVD